MQPLPTYSSFFATLYDEPEPVGILGRGAHYSVLRSVEWLDVVRAPLATPQVHDFAVIWDEDHDDRVIEAIERIYFAGLLSPVQFIGERKGNLTLIVAARFYCTGTESDTRRYIDQVEAIAQALDDPWPVEVGMFDRAPNSVQNEPQGIVMAEAHKVVTYLKNIDTLWSLGTKEYDPKRYLVQRPDANGWGFMPPPPPPPIATDV